jgi:hypothetical protein
MIRMAFLLASPLFASLSTLAAPHRPILAYSMFLPDSAAVIAPAPALVMAATLHSPGAPPNGSIASPGP